MGLQVWRGADAATWPEPRGRARRVHEVLAGGLFITLCALAARVAVPLPFTPVPVTLQVLAVLLGALALGWRHAAAAQVAYLALGAAGLPVFAAGRAGWPTLVGPTAGYLYGFVFAAAVTGWLAGDGRGVLRRFGACLAGVAIIHLAGALYLGGFLAATLQVADPWRAAWEQGAAPFLLFDVLKAALAAAVAPGGRLLLARVLAHAERGP